MNENVNKNHYYITFTKYCRHGVLLPQAKAKYYF